MRVDFEELDNLVYEMKCPRCREDLIISEVGWEGGRTAGRDYPDYLTTEVFMRCRKCGIAGRADFNL